VKELVDSGISHHGPFGDPLNLTTGGLVFVKAEPDQPSYIGNMAVMRSPVFQNSAPSCILVKLFSIFIQTFLNLVYMLK
jgi:hypothetical protein